MTSAELIPLSDPDFWQNPAEILAEFRDKYRTAYADTGELCVLHWDDAERTVKGTDFINQGIELLEKRGFHPGEPLHTWRSHALGIMNGADHIRVRKLAASALSKRNIEPLRGMIKEHANRLIDQIDTSAPVDAMRSFAYVLPRATMMEFLGLDAQELKGSEEPLAKARIADCFGPGVNQDMRDTANDAIQKAMDHVGELYQARRENPRDDLLTALLEAEDEKGSLSHEELITLFSTIFGSGATTGGTISAGLMELSNHPEAAQLLRSDPDRWKQGASEEVLRMHPGIVELPQKASHDFEAFDIKFKKDDTLSVRFHSTNRDPSRWDNAQQFDISRDPSTWSLSFGLGAHFCLGQAIARITIEEALAAFASRFSHIEPAEPTLWTPFVMENRLQGLKLSLQE